MLTTPSHVSAGASSPTNPSRDNPHQVSEAAALTTLPLPTDLEGIGNMSVEEQAVEFGELPPNGRGPGFDWVTVADALRANPGEWALVVSKNTTGTASTSATRIRNGMPKCFQPSGAFQSTIRGTDVWVRFVGDLS